MATVALAIIFALIIMGLVVVSRDYSVLDQDSVLYHGGNPALLVVLTGN